jgi:hypothetical protein
MGGAREKPRKASRESKWAAALTTVAEVLALGVASYQIFGVQQLPLPVLIPVAIFLFVLAVIARYYWRVSA